MRETREIVRNQSAASQRQPQQNDSSHKHGRARSQPASQPLSPPAPTHLSSPAQVQFPLPPSLESSVSSQRQCACSALFPAARQTSKTLPRLQHESIFGILGRDFQRCLTLLGTAGKCLRSIQTADLAWALCGTTHLAGTRKL